MRLKFYTEREWPECDVIVGNPPFLGDKLMRGELGDAYAEELWRVYGKPRPGQSDLCCYWFEKAREQVEEGQCKRAGLLATQAIRGGASREVLKRIKKSGDIFFAESDRDWILAGANVHVSMVGFDDGSERQKSLDGRNVHSINANLSSIADTTTAKALGHQEDLWAYGSQQKAPFDIAEQIAVEMLHSPNPNGFPNSDVVRPSFNAAQFLRRTRLTWVIDFGMEKDEARASRYEMPFAFSAKHILPLRKNHREPVQRKFWWMHARPSPAYRQFVTMNSWLLVTPAVSKHRVFARVDSAEVPDHQLIVFARSDDCFLGTLQSRYHEVWARAQATQVRERESGLRYTPRACFETFPFPFPDDLATPSVSAVRRGISVEPTAAIAPSSVGAAYSAPDGARSTSTTAYIDAAPNGAAPERGVHAASTPPSPEVLKRTEVRAPSTPEQHRAAIAAAARELNDLRERWLNPPEWTETRYLEFPGTVGGPWDRYIANAEGRMKKGEVGTVRYPRLEPRDAECAAKLKKRTLTNLYNERPAWLDFAHKKLDAAVAAAYGWPADLSDEQILEKLLALNIERAAEEAKAAQVKKSKAQRAKQAEEML